MSGDVTYQALDRLTYLPHRTALKNGNVIAGQNYYDVYITGGTITGITPSGFPTPLAISDGGTGQITANAALNALLPSQTGNSGKALTTNGTTTSWTVQSSGITQLTGDITAGPGSGSQATTLATVNTNVGSFGSSTAIPTLTINGKGLVTAASTNVVIAPAGTLSGTTLAATVVTSSLTSVGTITTGTWSGTTIAVNKGGTGLTTLTANSVIVGAGTSTPTFIAPGTSGNLLTSNGTAWASSAFPNLTGDVTSVGLATTIKSNVALSGSPTTTTQSVGDNTTKIATTAFVQAAAVFTKTFTSTGNTLTTAGSLTLPHSLGKAPFLIMTSLVCVTNNNGYTAGQELHVSLGGPYSGSGIVATGAAMTFDATNINIQFANNGTMFSAMINTSGATVNFTNANWTLTIRAVA